MDRNRNVCLSGLLLCLIVGGYLRLSGYDWGYDRQPESAPDAQSGYMHPDERGVYSKAAGLHWDRVDREEGESWLAYHWRAYRRRFLEKDSGLNIDSFNYGSMPYYLLIFLSWLGNSYSASSVRGALLALFLALFLLRWVVILARGLGDSERRPRISRLAAEAVLALAVYAVLFFLAGRLFCWTDAAGAKFHWDYGSWGRLGRPISAVFGTLTLLYTYRIGARIYGRRAGLFAAILLTFTVLHIQLSHFFTFDVILAFFTTASIYSLLVLIDSVTWGGRWRAASAAAVWAGLGLATKFSAILIFIPWFFAFLFILYRHRPHVAWYRFATFTFSLQVALVSFVSFLLVWFSAFLVQPFAFLEYPAGPKQPELAFAYFDFSDHPGDKPSQLRSTLASFGARLDPWTSPAGFHFKPHLHPDSRRPFDNRITIGSSRHWKDVDEQRRMALDGGGVPWTRQYNNTPPFIYQWKNLIVWGMGPPLGLLCLAGVFFGFGRPFYRPCWKELILLLWMAPNFIATMTFHTKFPRYLIPQVPFYSLWAAMLAIWGYSALRRYWERGGRTGWQWHYAVGLASLAALVWSAAYSLQYVRIYQEDHTWTVTSKWFEKNVPGGKKIVTEQWDDRVPWDGRVADRSYQFRATNPVHSDEMPNIREICRQMAWTDYYCFSSKRNYGAFLQSPETSPNRIRMVQSLFAGNLGFRLVKTFSRPVNVLGIPVAYELADESLSLYDHPTVHIFERTERLTAEEIERRIQHPPAWAESLTKEQILTATENRSILAPSADHAMQVWLLALVALGWIFWPVSFCLFRTMRDGGLFAAKMTGLVLLTYLAWFGASVGWWRNAAWATTLAFLLWMPLVALCVWNAGTAMREYLKQHWKLALLSELLFFAAFSYFMGIRMSNPDVYWGEKAMDAALVNSAYQSESFPAIDPWFSGRVINYYHYGHVMVGLLGRWVGAPPEYAYNLAAGTWPALVFVLVFGLVLNLTNSKLGALIASFLATMAGNVKSFIQLAVNLHQPAGPIDPKDFREGYTPHDGLSGYLADVWDQICSAFALAPQVLSKVWLAFRASLDPSLAENARAEKIQSLLGFDAYFWKLSRIVKSSVACEFPAWTSTFADLHAHMLVMPLTALTLSLAAAYCLRKEEVWRLKACGEYRCSQWRVGSHSTATGQLLMIGLLLGVVSITNTWDLPGLAGFFALGLMVVILSSCRNYARAYLWRHGRPIAGLRIWGDCFKRWGWWKLAFLQETVIPTLSVLLLSRALFYPFFQSFETPERVKGIGFMHTAASGWTTPYEFVQIFGVFAVIILCGLMLLYWRWATATRGALWKILLWAGAAATGTVLAVLYLRSLASAAYDKSAAIGTPNKANDVLYWKFVDADIAYLTGGFVLALLLFLAPFLIRRGACLRDRFGALVLGLGLAVVAGCEMVYIIEGWGPPTHRWNTVFKFHLQAWLCLSVGCGWLLSVWWRKPAGPAPVSGRIAGRVCRYALGYPILTAALLVAAVFPLAAPYLFSQADGFEGRTRQIKGSQTVDGLHFMRVKEPDVAATIDYLRTTVHGTPVVAEAAGESYQDNRARFSTHTGLPTLIGWVHHSRERGNLPEPRIEEARLLYTSTNRESVRDLLERERVRYVVVGPTERSLYSLGGGKGLDKFNQWTDLFCPVFTSNIKPPGVTVYTVDPEYRIEREAIPSATQETGLFVKDNGLPLLRGSEGFAPGQYKEPRAIRFSKSGQTYVADTRNHRVQSFDERGNFKWWVGEEGDQPGQFKEPNDLEIDEDGNLYVLDTWNSRVQIFSPTGENKQMIVFSGFGPRGIAVGRVPIAEASGAAWVLPATPNQTNLLVFAANTGAKNILVFDPSGRRAGEWGGSGPEDQRLGEPVDVEITPLGLAVSDPKNQRVALFDGRGRQLALWPLPTESTGGITNEMHLAWDDAHQRLLVTDPEHNQILQIGSSGQPLGKIPVMGTPTGIGLSPDGKILVTLRQTHKVTLVSPPGQQPGAK